MSKEGNSKNTLILKIPTIKADSETQTVARLVSKSPELRIVTIMEAEQETQGMSLRKRRNLSKNRGQSARQREKTPEPHRTPVPYDDTTTSDDEDTKVSRNSREIEADDTYEEMRRLVFEKAHNKDPIYDLDTDKVMEERAIAANERRRRSISPFAIPEKEELAKLERKGSFIDPGSKLLSTNYIMSPKNEDTRRGSLVIDSIKDSRSSLSSVSPTSSSAKDGNFLYPSPSTPKRLDEIVYPIEKQEDVSKKPRTPIKNENIFTFDEKEVKQTVKPAVPKAQDATVPPGNLVTKVIQIERSPSKKLMLDQKPVVEVKEKVVRTSSVKKTIENKPIVQKQSNKYKKDEVQTKTPPVKPVRSKSASKFVNKTSESEMSEDQMNQLNLNPVSKRKAINVPRRFVKHSPRVNRSQSMHRAEDIKVIDRTETGMSQTSREIIELMQKARARSLSIPKDDPRLLSEYKDYNRNLKTPNKTPSTTPRNTRGISCSKTIQIISDREILSGLTANQTQIEDNKHSKQSSGYIDASQSEYTSSCYSSSPSENEYDFDLSERTAELTRKLNILSQEVDKRETLSNIIFARDDIDNLKSEKVEQKSVLRKRSVATDIKTGTRKETKNIIDDKRIKSKETLDKTKKITKSRWMLIANWQVFKEEHKVHYERLVMLRNKCICNMMLLIIMCGLGGMMFKTLEGSFENAYKCGTRNVKRDFIESLWRGSHYLREEDWKSMARKKLYEFEEQLHTAHEAGVTSYSGQRSWNFMNSFVYCMTLVTTIGYGHIAPKTTYGRVATIIYAIIGIPLFLIILADFGKLFTRIIKFFWAFIRRFYYTRSCRKVRRTAPMQEVMKGLNIVYDVVRRPSQIFSEEEILPDHPPPIIRKPSNVPPPLPPKPGTIRDPENETEPGTPAPSAFEIDDEFNLPISVAIFILVVYIIIGAVAYNLWESWNFFESFYFVFISMSTIGLGDLVPDHPMYMMASIWYLVFGLALTSMCINVVQLKLSNTFKQASAKLGATIGLKVAEEDGSLVPITPPPIEIAPVHKPKTESDDIKSKEDVENVGEKS